MESGIQVSPWIAVMASAGPILSKIELVSFFLQGPIAFREIVLYFSSEEWALLSPCQRLLYVTVMMENYENVKFVGKADPLALNR